MGLVFISLGALLLSLVAEDALADAVLGGGGSDVLRGSERSEQLVGFGGEDAIWGLTGHERLSGGEGEDELYGGAGHDLLLGGLGADFIEAKDGERDYMGCGSGKDVVSVDLIDRVRRSCDTHYPG